MYLLIAIVVLDAKSETNQSFEKWLLLSEAFYNTSVNILDRSRVFRRII